MLAGAVALEIGENVGEGFLADLAYALRSQLVAAAGLPDVAGVFEHAGDLAELIELLLFFGAEEVADLVVVEGGQVVPVADVAELRFQVVVLAQALHEAHRLLQRQRFVAGELVAAPPLLGRDEAPRFSPRRDISCRSPSSCIAACIIPCSSLRCSGLMLCINCCMAPICCCMRSMRSSSELRPGPKKWPQRCMNS